jgi:predicted acetyltransferase
MDLVWPARAHLAGYVDALRRGWSPDTRRPEVALEHLARIEQDADLFLAQQVDREAAGPPIVLPDGSTVQRLPGYARWMWDGEFCGAIGFRWQPGTSALPAHVLGHIGYSVVPWKRRRGYATHALGVFMDDVRREGMEYVEITTDPDNVPSQRVIEANGGVLVERFRKLPAYGASEGLRYRIALRPLER